MNMHFGDQQEDSQPKRYPKVRGDHMQTQAAPWHAKSTSIHSQWHFRIQGCSAKPQAPYIARDPDKMLLPLLTLKIMDDPSSSSALDAVELFNVAYEGVPFPY